MTVTGGKPLLLPKSAASTASLVAKILLGAAVPVFAWRKRTQRECPATKSRWMAKLDSRNFFAAMVLGFLLLPWPLVAAGAVTATPVDLANASTILTLAGFCALASSSHLSLQAYVVRSSDRAQARLNDLNGRISVHRVRVLVTLSVAVGFWLIGASA